MRPALRVGLLHAFGDSRYRPWPLLKEMVATGRLGRKIGQGVYGD